MAARGLLVLLAFLNSNCALRVATTLPKRGRSLIAPVISALPVLPKREREHVKTYWKQDDSALSQRLARMLQATPSLQQPTYEPTTWAKNSKANFALAFARSRLGELRRKVEPPLSGGAAPRFSACNDEPDVTVEWAKDDACHALPPDAPIVVFLHTITGTAAQTRWLMSGASERVSSPTASAHSAHARHTALTVRSSPVRVGGRGSGVGLAHPTSP